MSEAPTARANAEQIEYWNGEAGQGWVDRNATMEKTLAPFADAAIAAAGVKPGEAVMDIGCGCADTSFKLLREVGPGGRVLGVDISAPMLALASERAEGLPSETRDAIAFELADASQHPFEPASFDLLFSRFGVMFFDDPVGAFANLHAALKPGGRLAFICWAPVPGNDWITVPMGAALQHVPRPEPMPPNAPGPFGLADAEYTRGVLTEAGFSDVQLAPHPPVMRFGHDMERDEIADFMFDSGPVSRLLVEASAEEAEAARASVRGALMPHYDGHTINLAASCWIVTARA